MTINARNSIASITYNITNRKISSGMVFNITFPFLNNEEYLSVWYRDNEQKKKKLILDTDYSIELEDGLNNIYGRAVLLKEIEEIENLTIERNVENDQDVNFTSDTLYSSTTEYALDKVTALIQDMNFKNYVLRAPNDEKLEDSTAYELPSRQERTNKVYGFGSDGMPRLYELSESGATWPATRTALGLVMIGDTLEINKLGLLDAPIANENRVGLVKPGENISIDADGRISVADTTYTAGEGIMISAQNEISTASPDISNWTAATLPSSASWKSVTYGNGKFVTVALDSNTAAYSADGISWTAATLPSSKDWNSVTYGNGRYVAVAFDSNTAAYSADGISWTAATLPSSAYWNSVTYGNGKFVAVASASNTVVYSADGISWTAATLPSSIRWYNVCYGNGRYVAVAKETGGSSNTAAYTQSKPLLDFLEAKQDKLTAGENITISEDSVISAAGTTYTAGENIAISENNVISAEEMYADPTTWKSSILEASNAYWYFVTYGNDRFVAVASGSNTVVYSTDGISWTASTLPSSAYWRSVTYGNDRFVAVAQETGGSSNTAAYSADGISWTAATLPSSASWTSVTYGNGKFVTVAFTSNKAAYSTDGITWTAATLPSSKDWRSVTYGDGKYVAVAFGSSTAAYTQSKPVSTVLAEILQKIG